MDVRRAVDRYRGGDPEAGIASLHSFSFGPHYDPDNLRFGPLLACNEERLAPGAGFAEHPHSHTEIITWVLSGELTHRDSAGHTSVVRPGDLQHLSAADGVRHVERNDGPQPLVFLQMWLAPSGTGGQPRYQVLRSVADATPYALPESGALLWVRRPAAGERVALPAAPRTYLHVVRGELSLDRGGDRSGDDGSGDDRSGDDGSDAGTTVRLGPGDAARLTGERAVRATAGTDAEVLVWEFQDVTGD
ncbi:pirin family protein [Streptomyces sp. NPDC007088]|uniref:pirin family protein n=1 Tax=Streptomyces sp. NPDC007088 TaxID=3364773 RepID=UPI0036A7FAA6